MSTPTATIPAWWPTPDPLTDAQVRQLYRWLRTITPPVLSDARRRIRTRLGDDVPIAIHAPTVRQLAGQRLHTSEALTIMHVVAGEREQSVSIAIGLNRAGEIVTSLQSAERWMLHWEPWTPAAHHLLS